MFDDYDVEYGYSLNELTRSYSRKAYQVPDYDLNSIREIEDRISEGRYDDKFGCAEHLQYLENLEKRLSIIALAEEREGIMNWELREVLDKVRVLSARLSNLVTTLCEKVVYS